MAGESKKRAGPAPPSGAASAKPEEVRRLARNLHGRGDSERAVRLLQGALRQDPKNLGLHLDLAGYLNWQERFDGVIRHARAALEIAPDEPKALWLLGSTLRKQGQPQAAAEALERAILQAKGSVALHYELGLARYDLGQLDLALDSLARALAVKPDHVWSRATEMSLRAERDAKTRLAGRAGAKRVALHMNQGFHFSILKPVFEALCEDHHALITGAADWVRRFDPDVVVVADAQATAMRKWVPRAVFVSTRHGLIEKNHFAQAAGVCDFVCVSSEAIRDRAVSAVGIDPKCFWVTGYPQMDPLFRPEALESPVAVPAGHKTVLYAPTYNAQLSSAPMLGERTVELIRGRLRDVTLVIKPHPLTCARDKVWMGWWHKLARDDRHVHLVTEAGADPIPYLKNADLLISDVSSVAYAYLAMDRPVILLTNPEREKDPKFDASAIEWRWRDIGEELFDAEALPAAVARALDEPGRHGDLRARYRELLFGALTDGRAAERIAAHIAEANLSRIKAP